MKQKHIAALLVLLVSAWVQATELNGSWQLVEGEYLDAEGQLVSYQDVKMTAQKVLSDHHFSFTSMRDGKFWAAGSGTYSTKAGHYTETLSLNSFGEASGAQFSFSYTVENGVWTNSRWKEGKRVEYEVWRKLE
ncbi:hypothetical protein [Rheinheimera sp.]|uniref:hypothetical protein n=1 Tax=Rheinheimera sp. TaxID=1869214 RepID=UPI00307F68F7